jgi:hypothetical protein
MPVSTSLQCPHCHYNAQTTKVILPGSKVRCPQCREVMHILPSSEVLVETLPAVDAVDATRLDHGASGSEFRRCSE